MFCIPYRYTNELLLFSYLMLLLNFVTLLILFLLHKINVKNVVFLLLFETYSSAARDCPLMDSYGLQITEFFDNLSTSQVQI